MKSVLIVDTPTNCGECEFHYQRLDGSYRCTRNKDAGNIILLDDVPPSWCPLLPLPEKKDSISMYGQGWNDCLDEIVKEK